MSTAEAAAAAQIIHGPPLIGNIINVLLFGIMIAQTYIYFTTYKDRAWIRLLVIAIFLVDVVNVVFNTLYLYTALIWDFGNMESILRANWYSSADPATTGVLGSMVQLFFAWRIHVLTRNWFMVASVVILTITGLVGALVSTYKLLVISEFARLHEFRGYIILWLASVSAADIIITTTLVLYLVCIPNDYKYEDVSNMPTLAKAQDGVQGVGYDDRSHYPRSVTVQTGLLTSLFAIIGLIIFLVRSNSGIYLLFNIPLIKLYSNSLLSSLNSRRGWKFDSRESESGRPEVGTFITENTTSPTRLETTRSSWNNNVTHTSRGPVAKAVNFFKSTRPSNGTKMPKVFVHVESHEMRESTSQVKGEAFKLDGSSAADSFPVRSDVVLTPARKEAEPSLSSYV